MQSATNSEDEDKSSEMEGDDTETNEDQETETNEDQETETIKDQETEVPFGRIRSKMKLRSTLSVWPPFVTPSRRKKVGMNRKEFMEKIHLKKEQEELSKKKKKKIIQCRFCPKSFGSKYDFQKHQRSHTMEKPFKCQVCAKGFSQTSGRNVHEASVCMKKEHMYTCPICGNELANSANLSNHLKYTHKMKERLNCDICNITVRSDMNRHVKTKRHIKYMMRIQDEAEEQFTLKDQSQRLKALFDVVSME